MAGIQLNPRRLKTSAFPTWVGLVFGSWFGLVWGALVSMPLGIGLGVAGATAMGGFLAVPLWGTVWGLVGLGGQRSAALRQHGITLLKEDDQLSQRVYALAAQLGIKTRPWVGVMPHDNAYAIGANVNNAMVVIGTPLLQNLGDDEVDAIIGHELGHVVNNDMRRMGLARSFQNSLVWYLGFSKTLQGMARWLLTWLSELAVLDLSRRREYWADAIGAALVGKEPMIAALEKIHNGPELTPFERTHARLMFRGFCRGTMFSTHPTLEQRRKALEKETFLKRLPKLKTPKLPPAAKPPKLPKAEDIAYAKNGTKK